MPATRAGARSRAEASGHARAGTATPWAAFDVGYRKGNRQGSRFVELTITGPGERFTQ